MLKLLNSKKVFITMSFFFKIFRVNVSFIEKNLLL